MGIIDEHPHGTATGSCSCDNIDMLGSEEAIWIEEMKCRGLDGPELLKGLEEELAEAAMNWPQDDEDIEFLTHAVGTIKKMLHS